jgi:hypothetical protein
MSIFVDSVVIAYKSPIVAGKRLVKFVRGGPPAVAEATRMVTEKAEIASISAASFVRGRSLRGIIKRYRRKVEADARRL